jgi:hypothetical protein
MAACGQNEPALRLLKAAVQQNYCAYSALLDDPLIEETCAKRPRSTKC